MPDTTVSTSTPPDWTDGAKAFALSSRLQSYVLSHTSAFGELERELIAETRALGEPSVMMSAPEQYGLMRTLTAAIGATTALEIGTFTGLSALAIARGLPEGGRLYCLDHNEPWTTIASRYWQRAGLAERIELRLGEALEEIRRFPLTRQFDFAFLDCDKRNLPAYYVEILPRLRKNGLLLVDNALWHGWILDGRSDPATDAVRDFNDQVMCDPRVEVTMLPFADGLLLLRCLA